MREVLAHQSEELRDANFALDHQAGLVRQYAALLDLVSDAVAVLAPDGVVLFWNRAAERLYGWAGAEIVGRKLQSLVPCETPLGAGAASATELRKQRHIRKDGSPVDVLSRWCVKKDSAEEIQAIVWLSQVT
jgi:PAS domain S-box-containing protein